MAERDCSTSFTAREEKQGLRDDATTVGAVVVSGSKEERWRGRWSDRDTGPIVGSQE
jgi:hypothetical protein